MYYTIASLEDYAGNQVLSFDKMGQFYNISLYNKDSKESTKLTIRDITKASKIYLELTDCILKGYYSFEQRRNILSESGDNYNEY